MKRAKIGDYFCIPISDRYAYGQYVYQHKVMGNLILVLDYYTGDPHGFSVSVAKNASALFPPIFTYLVGAINEGIWEIVGYSSVETFKFPMFLNYWEGESRFDARMWFLWDGKKEIKLGSKLPEKLIELEIQVIWSLEELTKRIESGINPYQDMINNG
jgi:hypothetical protein